MGIVVDISAKRIALVNLSLQPSIEVTEDYVLDGDGSQLLDGDGNPIFGWIEE